MNDVPKVDKKARSDPAQSRHWTATSANRMRLRVIGGCRTCKRTRTIYLDSRTCDECEAKAIPYTSKEVVVAAIIMGILGVLLAMGLAWWLS
jgi:hypothetical protein